MAPPVMSTALMTELKEMQLKKHKVTEEKVEEEIKTLVELDVQGEQLDNVDKGWIEANEDMRRTEKLLSGLEKSIFRQLFCVCCGTCELPCNKNTINDDDKTWGNIGETDVVVNHQPQWSNGPPPPPLPQPDRTYRDKYEEKMKKYEEKIVKFDPNIHNYDETINPYDQTLNTNTYEPDLGSNGIPYNDQIQDPVTAANGCIKNMQLDQEGVIKKQTRKLDGIQIMVEQTEVRLGSANKRIGNLLKREETKRYCVIS